MAKQQSTFQKKNTVKEARSGAAGAAARWRRLYLDFMKAISVSDVEEARFDSKYFVEQYDELMEGEQPYSAGQALDCYLENVRLKGLDPNTYFSERGYLDNNEDVVSAISDNEFFCGFHHWIAGGRKEQRDGWNKRLPAALAQISPEEGRVRRRVRAAIAKPLSSFDLSTGLERLSASEVRDILVQSGLVDIDRVRAWYPDVVKLNIDPVEHYIAWGHKENRIIHPFFDNEYYLRNYPDVASKNMLPLIHYLFIGAREGRNPHVLLDTDAYSKKHSLDLSTTNPLIHYSLSRNKEELLDTPFFDRDYYTSRHPESLTFAGGPFLHFAYFGVYAGLRPSTSFNPLYYYKQYLNNNRRINAYYHFLEVGEKKGFRPQIDKDQATIPKEVARFTSPGDGFELLDVTRCKGKRRRARLIAFYLPQFHAFPENDEWWGTGFTEWRNLPRAIPRFAGHYQPRIPRDLGFYNLDDPSVIERQVQMALDMGIWAFCFYFYWFNRHRLMEKPLDAFVANESLQMPFMILWANENWTRRWDGAEYDVLIKQDHLPEDDAALVDCLQGYFADSRYIRIENRPLLVIYRADIIPDSKATLDKWRALFKERHGEDPLFFLAQTFKAEDSRQYGFDGAIEFPPHKIGNHLPQINSSLDILDWDFEGSVRRYSDAIDVSLSEPPPEFPLVKTVFPSWDNSSRRQVGAMVFEGATPQLFGKWLDGAIDYSLRNPVMGENFVFINAWNEWCESAYLEPDIHYGGAMLNQVAETISASPAHMKGGKFKMLLVGHDAFPAGAQRNLLAIATTLQNRFGVEVHVVLLGDGALLDKYREAVPTTLCSPQTIDAALSKWSGKGYKYAIANTSVSGSVVRNLKAHDFKVVTLVHELPTLIREYNLLHQVNEIRELSDYVVFASPTIHDAFRDNFGEIAQEAIIRPQGIYQQFDTNEAARATIRTELGIADDRPIVLNVAYGDIRKGIDLFLQTANLSFNRGLSLQFVWVGAIRPSLKDWLFSDIKRSGITNIHFMGERTDVGDFMSAADVLYLTSREDPYPTVILEAMQVGLPVVAYADNGGFVDLLREDAKLGRLVTQGDLETALGAIATQIESASDADEKYRIARARDEFDFADYIFDLMNLLDPSLKKASVVVPSYNYERYISARLTSIFDQTYPIYELIVLDDASTDQSVTEIEATLLKHSRVARVVTFQENSGNVFLQWRKGVELARSELIWIAEADDLSEPIFLETMVREHIDNTCLFAFCDSQAIDSNGYRVYDSYIPYMNSIKPGLLAHSHRFSGPQFAREGLSVANLILNVSGVLWDTDTLTSAFAVVEEKGFDTMLVGDWLLYYSACRLGGTIAYVSAALNLHRRHPTSVTWETNVQRHVAEIEKMHAHIRRSANNRRDLQREQVKYVERTREWLAQTSKQSNN